MNLNPENDIIHDKPFLQLLQDTAWFVYYGARPLQIYEKMLFARMAVINSAFCLEAAANCCLAAIGLNDDQLRQQYMRSTEWKLNSYVRFLHGERSGKEINFQNSKEPKVHAFRELMQHRNEYVHPKVTVEKVHAKMVRQMFSTVEGVLQIPDDSDRWFDEHSERAIKGVSDFCNYFFTAVCGNTAIENCSVLCPEIRGRIHGYFGLGSLSSNVDDLVKRGLIDLGFIRTTAQS
jgi:hypothetical protein